MKFGCISIEKGSINPSGERVINIGDYMQLIAIMNLYRIMGIPEKDVVRIEYYDMFDYSGEDIVLPINFIWFNPFWGERELILPESIHPVFLGIHSIGNDYSETEINYLKKFEPIGCRDAYTYHVLRNRGIDTYLHGCLTATLPQREIKPQNGKVYFVDVPELLQPYIPEAIKSNAVSISHQIYGSGLNRNSWEESAISLLKNYKDDATLVVTSRLHCASPCMALGVPVVFAHQKKASSFAWITQLLKLYTPEEWDAIDWNPDAIEYEAIKRRIIMEDIQRIREVAGGVYNNRCSDYFLVDANYGSEFENGELMRIKRFAEENWKKNSKFEYAVYGVTQIAEHTYRYMKTNFPNAQLIDVYDNYRDLIFHGLRTKKIETFDISRGVYLIATGNSTSIASSLLFDEKGWNRAYLCTCYEGLHQKL